MPAKRRQPRLSASGQENGLLDQVNLRLLSELETDPRCPVSELARRVGMSAPAVRERVQRLEQAGVIAGYRTDVDPASLGFPVTAFTRIRPMPGALPKLAELAAEIPEITECYRITGEDCFLVKVHAPALDQLEAILDRFLTFGTTTTSIVVSTPVPPRHLPLPAGPAAAAEPGPPVSPGPVR